MSAASETRALGFDAPVLLVGGGAFDWADYADARRHAAIAVAADGGADRFAGRPEASDLRAVIGDMDSVSDLDAWRVAPGVQVLEIAEQNTTDLEKCLYSVAAPLYLALGFFGARLDHTLAATHAALRRRDRRVLFVGADDIAFLAPTLWRAELPEGARVSIWPIAPVTGVASAGLVWPIDGLALAAGERIGTSNRARGGEVRLAFDRPGAMILLERARLDVAVASLLPPDGAKV